MTEQINMRRSDIGDCRGCKASSEGVSFKGIFNQYGTHLKSDCGWWLRLSHNYDYTINGKERKPDSVGDLFCPPCLDAHNKGISDLIGDLK